MNATVLHCIWFPWHYSRKANALLSTSDQYKTTSTVNAHTVHRIDLSCWRVHFSTLYMAVHCSWLGMYHVQCTVYSAMYCTMYMALQPPRLTWHVSWGRRLPSLISLPVHGQPANTLHCIIVALFVFVYFDFCVFVFLCIFVCVSVQGQPENTLHQIILHCAAIAIAL